MYPKFFYRKETTEKAGSHFLECHPHATRFHLFLPSETISHLLPAEYLSGPAAWLSALFDPHCGTGQIFLISTDTPSHIALAICVI